MFAKTETRKHYYQNGALYEVVDTETLGYYQGNEKAHGHEAELYRRTFTRYDRDGAVESVDTVYYAGAVMLGGIKTYKRLASAQKRYNDVLTSIKEVEQGVGRFVPLIH